MNVAALPFPHAGAIGDGSPGQASPKKSLNFNAVTDHPFLMTDDPSSRFLLSYNGLIALMTDDASFSKCEKDLNMIGRETDGIQPIEKNLMVVIKQPVIRHRPVRKSRKLFQVNGFFGDGSVLVKRHHPSPSVTTCGSCERHSTTGEGG
jgi:hypothetical protein